MEELIFERNPDGENELLDGNGFFISYYNPYPRVGIDMFASGNGSDETALVNHNDPENRYRILNGDYRREYLKLTPLGLEACIEFYNKEVKRNGSIWSS